jgi:hypothetical protein
LTTRPQTGERRYFAIIDPGNRRHARPQSPGYPR